MPLRYENTINDMLAFQEFHYAHSPTAKRVMSGYRWGGTVVLFIFSYILWRGHSLASNLFFASFGSGLYAFVSPAICRRSLRRQALKMYSEGDNKGLTGEHELELIEGGFIERTPYNETKIAWGAVERIETTQDYTFIYINSVMALTIPHNSILEGDYKAFMEQIGQRFQPNQILQPVKQRQ